MSAVPWNALIGQAPAAGYLRAALRANRVASGYLFKGPAGVGKRTGAMVFAQALLCHQPPGRDLACGTCKSCRWLTAREGLQSNHPDLLLPLKKNSKGEEKFVGDQEPGIPMDAVQRLCESLHRGAINGPRRVAIVPEAHRLCRGMAESANAFLKTLEEPPAGGIVILTSHRPEGLLETITSRVQSVRFRRLSAVEILAGLKGRGYDSERAGMVVALSDGSLGKALELLEGDLDRWRKMVAQGLQTFGPKDCPRFGLALWKLAEEEGVRYFEKEQGKGDEEGDLVPEEEVEGEDGEEVRKTEAGWKRYVFGRLLEICEMAFRDGMVFAAGGSDEHLLQSDLPHLARHIADRFGVDGCEKVLGALRECRLATRLYIRGDLVGRVLAGRMVSAVAGS